VHRAQARATPPSRRDAAFAVFLSLVLGVGVLGVLLLNTSMQQQSHRLAVQHDRLASLVQRAQELQMSLTLAADPHRLEVTARRLHLRPAKKVRYVEARSVSERRRAAARDRAG